MPTSAAPGSLRRAERIVDIGALPNGPGSDGCDIGAVERGANAATALALFDDGFESGTTLAWWGERP